MLQVTGDYLIQMKIGDVEIPLQKDGIIECTVVQSLYKFLPELRMQIVDGSGFLSHLIPYDKRGSTIYLRFGKDLSDKMEWQNDFTFTIFRRSPDSQNNTAAIYDIRGLMKVPNLFESKYCRGLPGNIKTTLTNMATKEMGCDAADISPSLDYEKTLLQPAYRNVDLFCDLQKTLEGKNGEGGYFFYFKRQKSKTTLVVKTPEDFAKQNVQHNFIVGQHRYGDMFPITDYKITDNYALFASFAAKTQTYTYFDWASSQFVTDTVSIDDYLSLSQYHLVESDDVTEGVQIQNTGRSCDYTSSHVGKARSSYHQRLLSMIRMSCLTFGKENIVPGDIVKVIFSSSSRLDDIQMHQHSGYWMVEKVIQMYTDTHRTRLMLTRNGIDTSNPTTLLKAQNKKQ